MCESLTGIVTVTKGIFYNFSTENKLNSTENKLKSTVNKLQPLLLAIHVKWREVGCLMLYYNNMMRTSVISARCNDVRSTTCIVILVILIYLSECTK